MIYCSCHHALHNRLFHIVDGAVLKCTHLFSADNKYRIVVHALLHHIELVLIFMTTDGDVVVFCRDNHVQLSIHNSIRQRIRGAAYVDDSLLFIIAKAVALVR